MSFHTFTNSVCQINAIMYDSHVSLIRSVCDQLQLSEKVFDQLVERCLDKNVKIKMKKDTAAPKRPRSGYVLFGIDTRKRIQAESPTVSNQEMMSLIAAEWKKQDESEKVRYQSLAMDDKVRYEQEMHAYKNTLTSYIGVTNNQQVA